MSAVFLPLTSPMPIKAQTGCASGDAVDREPEDERCWSAKRWSSALSGYTDRPQTHGWQQTRSGPERPLLL